jgi:hypothetical protein
VYIAFSAAAADGEVVVNHNLDVLKITSHKVTSHQSKLVHGVSEGSEERVYRIVHAVTSRGEQECLSGVLNVCAKR